MKKETTPQKNEPGVSALEPGTSLLKKNEFTMIIMAALLVTALVFFFFFKGASTPENSEQDAVLTKGEDQVSQIAPGFEDRISALEISLAKIASSSGSQVVSNLDERITRIETAVHLKLDTLFERVNKLDTLTERMDKLEGRLSKLAVIASTPPPKNVGKPEPKVKKPAVAPKKKVQVTKKKAVTPKKTGQFHTVQKGETLWSISQKYNTTVAAIRKLNNLTPEDKIYPGSNLLVK
ncbi:LysM peptidoglycan-binding domain-containing protein [Desulfobacter latus]|uniref:LysM peptidoglycan-binding domain-containing protein n=1 Tax=Desulfobacter latus TaxID=2292 RepID=A0A850T251_9BACT|nr:LysM domain-containing protein [Desulfobacter latus]NWH05181.1 LysM peptidoglycan-binding domain-containing protein [Desulfobacter latus]